MKFNRRRCKSCTGAEVTSCSKTGWIRLGRWWLGRKGAGIPGEQHVEQASAVCPSAYGVALGRVKPSGRKN